MKFSKRQHQEGVSVDRVVFLLIKLTRDVVKDASRDLEKHLDAEERSLLPKAKEELVFFFLFALDYWWQTERARTQEEKRIWGEIFGAHLRIWFGGDPEGLAMFDTLQQRFIAYAEVVNKGAQLGTKLSGFCDMPGNLFLLAVVAPGLFTQALEAVSSFRR